MNSLEQQARNAYAMYIPKINTYISIFEDLKGKLGAISLLKNEYIIFCTEISSGAVSYGMLLVTNQNLIYIKPAMVSKNVQYISYSKIQIIEYKKSLMKSSVYVHMTDGEKIELFHLKCDMVAEVLNRIIQSKSKETLKEAIPKKDPLKKAKSDDVIDRIQELYEMKEKGILTLEEYEILKGNLIIPKK